jgi:hypothetical protein
MADQNGIPKGRLIRLKQNSRLETGGGFYFVKWQKNTCINWNLA